VLLLALGAGHDLWRATRPLPIPAGPGTPIGELPAQGGTAATFGEGAPQTGSRALVLLDLNRATAAELDGLPGIGPVLAARIVAHRQRHGPFASREELLAVRGIGPRLLARLGPRVRVGSNAPSGYPDTLAPTPP
jgi:competence protein ComEA